MKPGRPKKYSSKKALSDAVDSYFNSISRTEPSKNLSGEVILNDNNEPIIVTRFIVPPSISSLCLYLGIDRSTWQNYCDEKLNPKFKQVTSLARQRIEAYLEEQLLTREKGLQGVIFNLQNNYNWKNKQELELGGETRKDMLAKNMSIEDKLAAIEEATHMLTSEGADGSEDIADGEDKDEGSEEH